MPHEPLNDMRETSRARRRWWVAGVLVILLAVVVAVWWRSGPSAGPPTPEKEASEPEPKSAGTPTTIDIQPDIQRAAGLADQPAERRAIAETIETTGVVGPDETRLARIRPLADGRVTRVTVRVGDRVGARQTLLVYDSITAGELMSEYRAAVASLERANAEADVARRSLERADNLVQIGAVAKGERDRRAAEHQRAIADMNSARAGVVNLEQKLRRLGVSPEDLTRARSGEEVNAASRSTVSAPFGGVVIEVHAAQGEVITPERELFVIADLSRVWIQGDVYQKDIARIRVGQNALVTVDAYPGETFTGRVTYVSNVLDANTRTAKVRCEVSNRDGRLKAQMFASVALPVSMPRQALLIPARAVQDIDGVPTVFVRMDEEKFQTRAVRVGAAIGDAVEVVDGLRPGERVVTDGALMLKSRLKLRVEAEEER